MTDVKQAGATEAEGFVSLKGDFGLRREKEVWLKAKGSDRMPRLEIDSWTATQITALLPPDINAGDYRASVFNPEVNGDGNGVALSFQ